MNVSANLESRTSMWGSSRLKDLEDLRELTWSGKKRKRFDPHHRDICLRDFSAVQSLERHEKESRGTKCKSTAASWVTKFLAERLAEGHLLGRNPHNIYLQFDASRIGRPAVETLLNFAEFQGVPGGFVLAPAVPPN